MKILIDTNVLISAALNPGGTPFKAYIKAVTYPNHGVICEQNIKELKRIFEKKFPKKTAALEQFLSLALFSLELIPMPSDIHISESLIRDKDDRSILRAAIKCKADILLTGDKDFLESGIENPKILTPSEFLRL